MMGRFELGRLVATPGALAALADAGIAPDTLLARHHDRDWGDVPKEDARENELSVKNDYRIISAYDTEQGRIRIYLLWALLRF